jgi:hypothetical protein
MAQPPRRAIEDEDIVGLHIVRTLSGLLYAWQPSCLSSLRCLSALFAAKALSQADLSTLYTLLPPLLADPAAREDAAAIIEDCLISCTSFTGFMGSKQVNELAEIYAGPLANSFVAVSAGPSARSFSGVRSDTCAQVMPTTLTSRLSSSL